MRTDAEILSDLVAPIPDSRPTPVTVISFFFAGVDGIASEPVSADAVPPTRTEVEDPRGAAPANTPARPRIPDTPDAPG